MFSMLSLIEFWFGMTLGAFALLALACMPRFWTLLGGPGPGGIELFLADGDGSWSCRFFGRLFSVLKSGVKFDLFRHRFPFMWVWQQWGCGICGCSAGQSEQEGLFEFRKDRDPLRCFSDTVERNGKGALRMCEVKGRATELHDESGSVRRADKEVNDAADVAAELGRRRPTGLVITARRNHCISFSGSDPDPTIWSAGGLPMPPRFQAVDRVFSALPGLRELLDGSWQGWPEPVFSEADVGAWPYLVDIFFEFFA